MLRRMPNQAQQHMLELFYHIWEKCHFPDRWREATIIPIPKPEKDHSNPLNYRPIALTSCLCKLFERMINNRLVEYLEYNKIISEIQCGFRKYRATVDHLIRLETVIRKGFADRRITLGVFFDLEKAYDTTWRYGILKDLYTYGLRGRMPEMIGLFLKERRFRVSISNVLSQERRQEAGVPKGFILSVTLFAVKVNSLAAVIPNHISASLFVDDLQISCNANTVGEAETIIQPVLDNIHQWATRNGFKFSATKTNCMIFSQKPTVIRPVIYLGGQQIPEVQTTKFLGLHWDQRLTWIPHIAQLKNNCLKSLNLLQTLSCKEWGADQQILMRTYRLVIRPKLDYGCIVYSSASEATLKTLDVVMNEAMRISSGAFRTSPVVSLAVLTAEPPLSVCRKNYTLRYYCKTKCHFKILLMDVL